MNIHEKTANTWVVNRGYAESLSASWLIFTFDDSLTYRQFYDRVCPLIKEAAQEFELKNSREYEILEYVSGLTADDLCEDRTPNSLSLWEIMIPRFSKESVIATIMHGGNFFEDAGGFYLDIGDDESDYIPSFGRSWPDHSDGQNHPVEW
jgi:hypothetical protein